MQYFSVDKRLRLCYNIVTNKADGRPFHPANSVFQGPINRMRGFFARFSCMELRALVVRICFYGETVFQFRRCFCIATRELQINEEIRDREVRVIADSGEQLGIMPSAEALRIAAQRNLDLVKIAPQATPPVCKIMDYGKYRFDQQKREKEAKKNQRVIELKEVQLSLNIDKHDLDTKVNHALRFLQAGNKVKVSIRFRGREMVHPERGYEIMEAFAAACAEFGVIEKPAKMENRNMLMFLAAKTAK